MAKYYKFKYSAGYSGTEISSVFKFSDSVEERYVQEVFEEWYDEQRSDHGYFDTISEEEAEDYGIEEDYSEEI